MPQRNRAKNTENSPASLRSQRGSPPLPSYRVRESSRAKHVSIRVSVDGEVEIVVPPRFDRDRIPDIVARRQNWIEKTRTRLLSDRAQVPKDWQVEKPDTLLLRWQSSHVDGHSKDSRQDSKQGSRQNATSYPAGFGQTTRQTNCDLLETWSIEYQPTASYQTFCTPDQACHHLTLQGNTDHLPAVQAVLRKWLADRAQRDIAPWLRQVGRDIGLPCRHISVRGQKTIWASCSTKKDISLNFKLLFLPRPLVHYVLVHELCHTVHMNHSKHFWALVAKKQPDYQWRRDALKKAWRYVPRWVETK
ncbi:MAG: SprT family zinc-dependent metalloprotease [Phormidesmis sp.]